MKICGLISLMILGILVLQTDAQSSTPSSANKTTIGIQAAHHPTTPHGCMKDKSDSSSSSESAENVKNLTTTAKPSKKSRRKRQAPTVTLPPSGGAVTQSLASLLNLGAPQPSVQIAALPPAPTGIIGSPAAQAIVPAIQAAVAANPANHPGPISFPSTGAGK